MSVTGRDPRQTSDAHITVLAQAAGLLPWLPGEYADGSHTHELTGFGDFALSANTIYYTPMFIPFPITIEKLSTRVSVQSGTGGATARLGLFGLTATGLPGALLVDAGAVAIDSTGTKDTAAINYEITTARWIYRAILASAAGASVKGYATGPAIAKRTDPSISPLWSVFETFTYGPLPATATPGVAPASPRTVLLKVL